MVIVQREGNHVHAIILDLMMPFERAAGEAFDPGYLVASVEQIMARTDYRR
jgi:hypothetical protein